MKSSDMGGLGQADGLLLETFTTLSAIILASFSYVSAEIGAFLSTSEQIKTKGYL